MKEGIKKYTELELAPLTREERSNSVQNQIPQIEKENWNFEDVLLLLKEVEKKGIYIRQPLFEKIIYPILKSEIKLKNAEAIKILIKLEMNLFAYQRKYQIDEYTHWNLVEKGLEFDENDKELLGKYESLLNSSLDYTIHHIPDILIYNDLEDTTPDRCDEFLDLLETYRNVCKKLSLDTNEDKIDLIEECNFHYQNYKEFLLNKERYADYKDYLKTNKLNIS